MAWQFTIRNASEETLEECFAHGTRCEAPSLPFVLDDKESRVTLKFDKNFDEGQAQICEAMLSDIESTMYNSYEYSNIALERNWLTVDDGFVLTISLNRYNEDPDPIEFTDEIYEKIADAVNGSFGDIQGKSDDYTSGKWDDWDDWHDDEGNTVDGEIAYG